MIYQWYFVFMISIYQGYSISFDRRFSPGGDQKSPQAARNTRQFLFIPLLLKSVHGARGSNARRCYGILMNSIKREDKTAGWNLKLSPTFHVRMKNCRVCWGLGQRSSLHFCFRRISEVA